MRSLLPFSSPGVHVSELKNKFYTKPEGIEENPLRRAGSKKVFAANPENVRNSYGHHRFLIIIFGGFAGAFLSPFRPAGGLSHSS